VIDAVVAQTEPVGVNIYVAVAVLLTVDGDHVPAIPSTDVGGSVGAVAPLHIE